MRIRKERHFTGVTSPEITKREISNRAIARKKILEIPSLWSTFSLNRKLDIVTGRI